MKLWGNQAQILMCVKPLLHRLKISRHHLNLRIREKTTPFNCANSQHGHIKSAFPYKMSKSIPGDCKAIWSFIEQTPCIQHLLNTVKIKGICKCCVFDFKAELCCMVMKQCRAVIQRCLWTLLSLSGGGARVDTQLILFPAFFLNMCLLNTFLKLIVISFPLS